MCTLVGAHAFSATLTSRESEWRVEAQPKRHSPVAVDLRRVRAR